MPLTEVAGLGYPIVGILDHDEDPPPGTPAGTIFLIRPAP